MIVGEAGCAIVGPVATLEEALQIIEHEAKEGAIDKSLVEILIESQVYRRVLEEDWREF